MIKSRLCDLIGIKYPIIQAGMGPFSNNNLGVAAANAGVLGLFSTSGLCNKDFLPFVYDDWIKSAEANPEDDITVAI
ncbi:MAG: nitronate monooxygenase, partial [Deltaproteobacteria bacterium]|nr:nitronate monooxygenase [Deltaproteobacteria bacterium]